jgi:hypothetical protein
MPELAMCPKKNNDCPSKNECYRHEAEPSFKSQQYLDFNKSRTGNSCTDFLQNLKIVRAAY